MLPPWMESILEYNAESNKLILKQCLFHVLIIRLTSQAFTQWHRRNILQHFLLLWKGSTPFFLLLVKDGKCYLSMYQ